jgi:hypothetical protein
MGVTHSKPGSAENITGEKQAEGSRQQAVKALKEKTSGLDTACLKS